VSVAALLACDGCGEPIAWRGIGRVPALCPSCRARRSGRWIATPATVKREAQRQAVEETAISTWAKDRAAEIRRRVRRIA